MILLLNILIIVAAVAPSYSVTREEKNESVQVLSKLGSRGNEVRQVQTKLKSLGYYTGKVDGIYGTGTQSAVKKFQKNCGITVDGIAGPKTLLYLGITNSGGSSGSTGGCLVSSDAGAFDSVGALAGSEETAEPLSCLSSFDMQTAGSAASFGAFVGAFGSVDTGSKEAGVSSCGVGAFGVFAAACPCKGSAAHPESNTESRSAHNMRFFFMG